MEPPRKKPRPSSVDYDAIETLVKRRWDDASREEFERMRAEASRVSRTAVDTFDHRACQLAAADDNFAFLRYIYERQYACAQRIFVAATENDHLECLKHAYKHGCPWDKLTDTKDAEKAEKRLWELISYVIENECPWSCSTCESAAEHGHLECLQYAREHGCPWDEDTCQAAAKRGHLQCLKYAHEHGCPWDELTCAYAATLGHLECLKFAREHGCPWSEYVCSVAAAKSHLECLQYAREVGAEGTDDYADILDDYVHLWMPFIEHIAIAGHGTTTTPELSARQFHELYKEFDARRLTLKARLRERASDISLERHKRARHLDMWTEYRALD